MVIENGELMHEYFPKHSLTGTARMKYVKVTDEEGKKRGVSMERSIADTEERSSDGLSLHNQITILIIIIKTSSTSPNGKNDVVYKLLSQPRKHLLQ